jgi:hypothetical protein
LRFWERETEPNVFVHITLSVDKFSAFAIDALVFRDSVKSCDIWEGVPAVQAS